MFIRLCYAYYTIVTLSSIKKKTKQTKKNLRGKDDKDGLLKNHYGHVDAEGAIVKNIAIVNTLK